MLAAGFFLVRELGSRHSLFLAGTISLGLALAAVIAASGKNKVPRNNPNRFGLYRPLEAKSRLAGQLPLDRG